MTLVSFSFICFFAVLLFFYYAIPAKFQWVLILLSNLVFYYFVGTPHTFTYLLLSIISTWLGSNRIARLSEKMKMPDIDTSMRKRIQRNSKITLIFTLCINVGMLATFKYMDFFVGNLNGVLRLFGNSNGIQTPEFAASLGISFYTLQMVGYLLDSYWGISKPQKNLLKLAAFACYFPQMISGPISRYRQLGNQLYEKHEFDYTRVCFGLQRMLIGFFKKLVMAGIIAIYTDRLFDSFDKYNGLFVWLGIFAYVVQIYADFSGCMDIVLGASECLGIYLPENFNRPFASRSIQEFWQRWHITLGEWLKDYIMYPVLRSRLWASLAKSLKKKWGKKASKNIPTYLAMLILWFFMGLWHGGGWNYIAEGIWFWLVITLGRILESVFYKLVIAFRINIKSKVWLLFQRARTTCIYAVGALFFVAGNLGTAMSWISKSFVFHGIGFYYKYSMAFLRDYLNTKNITTFGILSHIILVALGIVLFAVLAIMKKRDTSIFAWLAKRNIVLRWLLLYALIICILLFGLYGSGYNAADFIYGGF